MTARNSITDIPGIRVGHAGDAKLCSGTTVVVFDAPAVASVDVRGGGPGTRETALLDPAQTVEGIDAIVLSGGSAFGLDAASGVQAYLREQGRGFQVREARVPIVPGAILFDLLNGGDKNWGRYPPYREFGYEAAKIAGSEFALGSAGAGLGATTVNLKGGVGSASAVTRGGITVGALAVVNAVGTTVVGDGPHFWAAAFEQNGEFGGRGPVRASKPARRRRHRARRPSRPTARWRRCLRPSALGPAARSRACPARRRAHRRSRPRGRRTPRRSCRSKAWRRRHDRRGCRECR